jgi:hypothetical protein
MPRLHSGDSDEFAHFPQLSRLLLMLFKETTAVLLLLMATAAYGQQPGSSPPAEPTWLESPPDSLWRLPPVASDTPSVAPDAQSLNLNPPPKNGENTFLPPGMGDRFSPFRYRATWYPTVPVSGQNANFTLLDQNLSVAAPLWMAHSADGGRPTGGWLLTAGVRNESIDTKAILPDTGQPYPEELWNVNMGLMYFRKLDSGWSWGGGANLGSASDRPFASIDEMFVGMNAFLRIPSGEHNAWMFSLMYAPMSELRFPIPGVAYYYAPNENFHANIGLPFSLFYRPVECLTLEASYMPIHTIHAKAKYKIVDCLSLFAAYDWTDDAYALADRTDVNQRFFMYNQRLAGGLETRLGAHWSVELAGGLVFDRYSFEGKQWDTTQFNRVSFGNGPFVTLQAGLRF